MARTNLNSGLERTSSGVNPFQPPNVDSAAIRRIVKHQKRLLLLFGIWFLLTMFIPLIEFHQLSYVHHLAWWHAYIGLFIPEYRSNAILYVASHLAICTVLTFVTDVVIKITLRNVVGVISLVRAKWAFFD